MERGSDKHGPRLDDALGREVEGLVRSGRSPRAEDWREPEPSGEDEPDTDRVPDGTLTGGTPDGMTGDDVTGRTELAAVLGRTYPADRSMLIAVAEENNASDSVLAQLRELPDGRQFENVNDVWTALGHGVEEHRF